MKIEQITVGTMGVCCYLVSCEKTKKAALIDVGGDEDRVLAAIEKAGLDLQYIIATHGHPDHVCGNRRIQEATGAKIIMHALDAEFFAKAEVKDHFSHLGLEFSPPVDITVVDGDTINIGEVVLKVLHTPGHTPGGMCLYNNDGPDGDLFTGDTLFVTAVGRTDFMGGNHQDLLNSIRTKLFVLPDETIVWPGHGYGGDRSHIGFEKRANPFLK
ncbi:MBL fold metallo-hydrolase [Desulfotalea psychrophila]|nr:MBL fold metallo-hydrolase [Desulfotalea psychrophila]